MIIVPSEAAWEAGLPEIDFESVTAETVAWRFDDGTEWDLDPGDLQKILERAEYSLELIQEEALKTEILGEAE